MDVASFKDVWAPGVTGGTAKASVGAGAASAATLIRAVPAAQTQIFPIYITIKSITTTAGPGFHLTFGNATLADPTLADMPIQDVDGWIRLVIPPTCTHFKILSEGTTVGSVYVYLSGKTN